MERSSDDDLLVDSFWKTNPQDSDESSCTGNRTQHRSETLAIPTNCSGMKKSTSEWEFEAFQALLRPEIPAGGDLFSVDDVCCSDLGEMGDDTTAKHGSFRNLAAVLRDRDTVKSYSACAQVTAGLGWSQNPNGNHSWNAATVESQSPICGPTSMSSGLSFGCPGSGPNGSPTSCHKPKNGDFQVRTATSGSSREQSDDDDLEIEAGSCDQSMGTIDLKRMRRMVSNRESARRSRRRKQAQLNELELQVDQLKGQNASLHKQLTDVNQQCHEAATNNRVLRSDVEALRATVKLAEDMATRGTLACNVNNHLFQNQSVPPRNLVGSRYLCRPSEGSALTDESGYASTAIPNQIPVVGTEMGDIQNPNFQRIANLDQLQSRIATSAGATTCGSDLWP